jgi:hypothetical protein
MDKGMQVKREMKNGNMKKKKWRMKCIKVVSTERS